MKKPTFIETMLVENDSIQSFEYHLRRMKRTSLEVFGCNPNIDKLRNIVIPPFAQKCRIVYDTEIKSIEFGNYVPRQIRSLKFVNATSQLDYHLKYEDRSEINKMLLKRGECDDILIIRDGEVTDTSFSNVVFIAGGKCVTPEKCLLLGTMRAKLLESSEITTAVITPADISKFSHVALINAMLPLGRMPLIPIEQIKW